MSFRFHYNLTYDDLKDSVEHFSWNSQQTKLATKTALSCVTAIFIANLFKLDMPFWAGITTLVIMRPNVGASFSKGWMRTGGCTIGCMLALFFTRYTIQNLWLFSGFLFVGIFLSFYTAVNARNGYFWAYMLGNMALISMISLADPYDTFPIHIAFFRAAEISLGVLVSWLFNILLWPNYAASDLEDSLNSLLSKTILLHRDLIIQYSRNEIDPDIIKSKYNQLNKLLDKCKSIISNAECENRLLRNDRFEYQAVVQIIDKRIRSLDNIVNQCSEVGRSDYPALFSGFFEKVALNFDRLAKVESRGDRNVEGLIIDAQQLHRELDQCYEPNVSKTYPIADVLFFHQLMSYIESFCEDLLRISKCEAIDDSMGPGLEKPDLDAEDYVTIRFFSRELPLYIPSLKNAVKGGIAILFVFWFCLWLQIPGGFMNMSVAIIAVFGPQLDALASKHKGMLRLIGCLLGASIGLFLLRLNIGSAFLYFSTIFYTTFWTSYVFGARPGVAYVGLQAGIAFLICFAGEFGQVQSIAPVIERAVGIFLAITLMWIVNSLIWPDDLIQKARRDLLSIRNYLIDYASNGFPNKIFGLSINVASIRKTLRILDIQQDLPPEEISNIENWTSLVLNVSNKVSSISSLPDEVVDLILSHYPNLIRDVSSGMVAALCIEDESERAKALELLDQRYESIHNIMLDMRNKEVMREKSFEIKFQAACFLMTTRRIVHDLRQLAQVDMNPILRPGV